MTFLSQEFLGNAVSAYALATVLGCSTWLALRLVRHRSGRYLQALAQRTATPYDDVLPEMVESARGWFIVAMAIRAATLPLELSAPIERTVTVAATVALLLQIGLWAQRGIRRFVEINSAMREAAGDTSGTTTMRALAILAQITIWVVVLLVALDNFGVNVTALVASLGILGIAVGFALQSVAADLFAALSIVLDKPFGIGDFIVVDTAMGHVEHVGLKSTRIRSLSGEQLVISNGDLLKSRIRNYRRMTERRILFRLTVTYGTDAALLRQIPSLMQEIIEAQEETRFDRAHFKDLGPHSLDFEVVYWVLTPDHNRYLDIHQAINLALVERFRALGIEFAFPTQTVHVARS